MKKTDPVQVKELQTGVWRTVYSVTQLGRFLLQLGRLNLYYFLSPVSMYIIIKVLNVCDVVLTKCRCSLKALHNLWVRSLGLSRYFCAR